MSNHTRLIIGLGKTGWSVARFFKRQGLDFRAMDTGHHPSHAQYFKTYFPEVPIHIGSINPEWVQSSREIILSPGIDPKHIYPYITDPETVIYSDIDLFQQAVNAPVIAVTGSNGKSTVTVLIEHLLTHAGKRIKAGGNLGIPALELLVDPPPDFYVLELSSFQLSITKYLKTAVSLFLNFSADHLERHQKLMHYHSAKQAIYRNCHTAIWNRDEPCTYPAYKVSKIIDFGSDLSSTEGFGLLGHAEHTWLAQGEALLVNTQALKIKGTHNYLNALSAIAASKAAINYLPSSLTEILSRFTGLPHRLEWVCAEKGITWINDSKATNSHATHAALSSLSAKNENRVVLIAGGIHKHGDNLDALIPVLKKYVKQFVLVGRDALLLKRSFQGIAPIHCVSTLEEAVKMASNYAISDDTILFSPACSSQDMFTDYAERGECFKTAVKLTLNLDKSYDK